MKHIQTLNTRDMAKSASARLPARAHARPAAELQTRLVRTRKASNLHETYGKHPRGRPECVSTPAMFLRGRSL